MMHRVESLQMVVQPLVLAIIHSLRNDIVRGEVVQVAESTVDLHPHLLGKFRHTVDLKN